MAAKGYIFQSTTTSSRPSPLQKKTPKGVRLLLLLLICASVSIHRVNLSAEKGRQPINNADIIDLVQPPALSREKESNKARTLFLLPGKENRCHYQYDYTCKFWFYVRCYIFGAFPNIKMLSLGPDAYVEVKQQAKAGDIAAVIWRSKNHSLVPENLLELLSWREHMHAKKGIRIKIGVFHISNEKNRANWHWYLMADFVVRNYWIPQMPMHVTYAPLGHQLPNICMPYSTEVENVSFTSSRPACSCNGLGFKAASKRKYLWNFSGSIRKKRGELLRKLQKSLTLKDRGYVKVSKQFGGAGEFGSKHQNPKTEYLESILHSQFVFAPCGNVMETHRIYEAISLGAIPIVENCDEENSVFFPFKEVLIDGGLEPLIAFVDQHINEPEKVDALQARVQTWWKEYSQSIAKNVSDTMLGHVPPIWKGV